MSTVLYVASRSSSPYLALEEGNLIALCGSGPDPRSDAESYARDETKATDKPTYVFAVEISKALRGFKVYKEVNSFVPAE